MGGVRVSDGRAVLRVVSGGALTDYDPEHGLKAIALAETLERYARRAKDPETLGAAVEEKLSRQREFVVWWDEQGFSKAGSPILTDRKGIKAGSDGIPDSITIHRWRTRLKSPEKFEKALTAAQERCRRICEAEKGGTEQKGASGTGENEWYTPKRYVDLARSVLGAIDLDPASSPVAQRTVEAAEYFTVEDDGLAKEWHGRVWLNPPYAQPAIAHFVEKMVAEVSAGRVTEAVMLTHNYTDTAWFHLAASIASAICFTRGRIGFQSPSGETAAPTQGQAFFYYGSSPTKFADVFREVGLVVATLD